MLISDYDYELPESLIAQYPLAERGQSRLLVFDEEAGGCVIHQCEALDTLLKPGDLVIGNDTRVIPARVFANKPTGGRVEVMLERVLDDQTALVQLRSNKSLKRGQTLQIGQHELVVDGRQDRFYLLAFPESLSPIALFEAHGVVPLPPYIQRDADGGDDERYQTVYSTRPGAVAAPTAGLHIDEALLQRFADKGIGWDTVTLHVGAGTFLPVTSEKLSDHVMHSERITVSTDLCERIRTVREQGGAIVAIGTTVVRALESAAASGELEPFEGETDLFIQPGYRFRVIDQLLTNFHLPKSTLLVLVSAFAGRERIKTMYQYAIEEKMRFFSYGDAMLLRRQDGV